MSKFVCVCTYVYVHTSSFQISIFYLSAIKLKIYVLWKYLKFFNTLDSIGFWLLSHIVCIESLAIKEILHKSSRCFDEISSYINYFDIYFITMVSMYVK